MRHLILLTTLLTTSLSFGQQPLPPDKLKERDLRRVEAEKALVEDRNDDALTAAKAALALDRELFGPGRVELLYGLDQLARVLEAAASWDEAKKLRSELIDLREKTTGPNSADTTDARRALARTEKMTKFTVEERSQLRDAGRRYLRGHKLTQEKKFAEAALEFQLAAAVQKKLFGEDDLEAGFSLIMHGRVLSYLGEHDNAVARLEEALALYRKIGGPTHRQNAFLIDDLGNAHERANDFKKATTRYREGIDLRRTMGLQIEPPLLQRLLGVAQKAGDFSQVSFARELLVPFGATTDEFWKRFDELWTAYQNERDDARKAGPESLERVAGRQADFIDPRAAGARRSGDLPSAIRLYNALLAVWTDARGESYWEAVTARVERDSLERILSLPPGDRFAVDAIFTALANGSTTSVDPQRLRQLFGPGSPEDAIHLGLLAGEASNKGDFAGAEKNLIEVVQIRRRVLGETHPQTAGTMCQLAHLYYRSGQPARSVTLFQSAAEIFAKTLDPQHPAHTDTLNNLAVAYQSVGDDLRATRILTTAYDLFLKITDDPTRFTRRVVLPGLTTAIAGESNWSGTLKIMMTRAAMGSELNKQAAMLNNLGRAEMGNENFPEAIRRLNEANQIHTRQKTDPKLQGYYSAGEHATCLNNLGFALIRAKELDQASRGLEESLAIRKKIGETHLEHAVGLNSLALLRVVQGKFDEARTLLEQSAGIYRKGSWDRSIRYADVVGNLALLDSEQGKPAEAIEKLTRVLEITRANIDESAMVQTERDQLARLQSLRGHLDAFVGVSLKSSADAQTAYTPVLRWKGSVFLRQRRLRERQQLLESSDPKAIRLATQLEEATRELVSSIRSLETYYSDYLDKRVRELAQRRDALEQQLIAANADLKGRVEAEKLTPAQLASTLPEGAVLVDFLEFTPPQLDPFAPRERRLAVFVVRRDKPVVAIDLGAVAPLETLIESWREATASVAPESEVAASGLELRKRLWEPLTPHLGGATLVLLSPDGAVSRMAFAALPGSDPKKYLLEEVPLVTVPVPQDLPRILAQPSNTSVHDEATLLLVGDVDFGVSPPPTNGRAERGSWMPLPGTRSELVSVRALFEKRFPYPDSDIRTLRGSQATEESFRVQAPRHRWLHLATHGYFTGRGKSTTAEWLELHPGLQSGLVLTGANRDVDHSGSDGMLTALEVAGLNLGKVDGVVLSACESGLGESAQGEGVLGLQRAFTIAGAKSSVTTLWSIPDEPTQRLMSRFYENLWEKKMTRVESLRDAQLWMLREGKKSLGSTRGTNPPEQVTHAVSTVGQSLSGVTGLLPGAAFFAEMKTMPARGLVFKRTPKTSADGRLPPYYWAAFVLAGDWR